MQDNLYKYLSDETKAKINNLDIVTPSLYGSIFKTIADKNNIDINDEEKQANELLGTKLEEITAINEATDKKVIQLDKNTKKAIKAIGDKDEALLNETLIETKALRQEIEALKKSLYKDTLTKVYNRQWLNTELLNSDEKFTSDGTIFIIDMNYFKQINDNYGHIAGDKALTYVANHLQKLSTDIVRYGGDEFMAIFRERDISKFSHKLHINREVLMKKHLKFHDDKFKISYSYGGIEFKKGDIFAQILEDADTLMYKDKEKVKQRIQA